VADAVPAGDEARRAAAEKKNWNTTLTNNETMTHKTAVLVAAVLLIQLTSSQPLAPHKPSRPLGPAPSKTNTPHSLKQQPPQPYPSKKQAHRHTHVDQ
jgi:hypothetical protein